MKTKKCRYAIIGVLLLTLTVSVFAKPLQVTLRPITADYQIDLRTQPTQELTFPVLGGNNLTITVYPASNTLTLKLRLPNGTVVDKQNASQSGVSFDVYNPTTADEDFFVLPLAMQIIKVPNPFPGLYELQAEGAATTVVPVQVTTAGSGLRTGIIIGKGEFEVLLGSKVTLAVVVFEQNKPVTGTTVQGRVLRIVNLNGLVEETSLNFVDNGQGVDARANDGLYSASYEPTQTGGYVITVNLQGTTSQGLPFEAKEGGRLVVNPPDVKLNGVFHDQGVDEDGDGYFDFVKFQFDAEGPRSEGNYYVRLILKAQNGNEVEATGRVSDPTAPLSVNFPAEELKKLDMDGPYRLIFVTLDHDHRYLSRLEDFGDSSAYRLDTLERKNTLLHPLSADRGVDVDGDGLFDRLEVVFGVDVLISGSYGISAELIFADQKNESLDNTALTSVYLPRGNHNITLAFSGEKIGRSGKNGPYLLKAVGVYPLFEARFTGAWASRLGATHPYSCTQFAGCDAGDPNALLERLLRQVAALNLNQGLKNSLRVKLTGAQAALAKNNLTSAYHKIGAFLREVTAQQEKTIPQVEAEMLIDGGMILVNLWSSYHSSTAN